MARELTINEAQIDAIAHLIEQQCGMCNNTVVAAKKVLRHILDDQNPAPVTEVTA